jgi:hypothetical protein
MNAKRLSIRGTLILTAFVAVVCWAEWRVGVERERYRSLVRQYQLSEQEHQADVARRRRELEQFRVDTHQEDRYRLQMENQLLRAQLAGGQQLGTVEEPSPPRPDSP